MVFISIIVFPCNCNKEAVWANAYNDRHINPCVTAIYAVAVKDKDGNPAVFYVFRKRTSLVHPSSPCATLLVRMPLLFYVPNGSHGPHHGSRGVGLHKPRNEYVVAGRGEPCVNPPILIIFGNTA